MHATHITTLKIHFRRLPDQKKVFIGLPPFLACAPRDRRTTFAGHSRGHHQPSEHAAHTTMSAWTLPSCGYLARCILATFGILREHNVMCTPQLAQRRGHATPTAPNESWTCMREVQQVTTGAAHAQVLNGTCIPGFIGPRAWPERHDNHCAQFSLECSRLRLSPIWPCLRVHSSMVAPGRVTTFRGHVLIPTRLSSRERRSLRRELEHSRVRLGITSDHLNHA